MAVLSPTLDNLPTRRSIGSRWDRFALLGVALLVLGVIAVMYFPTATTVSVSAVGICMLLGAIAQIAFMQPMSAPITTPAPIDPSRRSRSEAPHPAGAAEEGARRRQERIGERISRMRADQMQGIGKLEEAWKLTQEALRP